MPVATNSIGDHELSSRTTTNASVGRRRRQQQWSCGVCKEQTFDEYTVALQHEARCRFLMIQSEKQRPPPDTIIITPRSKKSNTRRVSRPFPQSDSKDESRNEIPKDITIQIKNKVETAALTTTTPTTNSTTVSKYSFENKRHKYPKKETTNPPNRRSLLAERHRPPKIDCTESSNEYSALPSVPTESTAPSSPLANKAIDFTNRRCTRKTNRKYSASSSPVTAGSAAVSTAISKNEDLYKQPTTSTITGSNIGTWEGTTNNSDQTSFERDIIQSRIRKKYSHLKISPTGGNQKTKSYDLSEVAPSSPSISPAFSQQRPQPIGTNLSSVASSLTPPPSSPLQSSPLHYRTERNVLNDDDAGNGLNNRRNRNSSQGNINAPSDIQQRRLNRNLRRPDENSLLSPDPKQVVKGAKWVCDICHVAKFVRYVDAYKHEKICTGARGGRSSGRGLGNRGMFEEEERQLRALDENDDTLNEDRDGVDVSINHVEDEQSHLNEFFNFENYEKGYHFDHTADRRQNDGLGHLQQVSVSPRCHIIPSPKPNMSPRRRTKQAIAKQNKLGTMGSAKFLCSVCEILVFDTYDKALRHEEYCAMRQYHASPGRNIVIHDGTPEYYSGMASTLTTGTEPGEEERYFRE